MNGAHPQDDLPGLLLGELPPAAAVAVDRHLAGCDPCRRDLAAVAVASSALRDISRLPFAQASDLLNMAHKALTREDGPLQDIAKHGASMIKGIDLLLERIALSRSDGSDIDEHRINLLTLHSTKGLEFSRVYVVGAEDAALPGFHALNERRE